MTLPKLSGEGIPGEREALVFILACCKAANAEALADRLLREHGSLDAALEFVDTLGLGEIADATVASIAELGTSRELHLAHGGRRIDNTESAGRLLISWFYGCDVEQLVLLCLNDDYRLIDCKVVATGSAINVRFDPKALLRGITEPDTRYVILAHNHPSTPALPSQQDVRATAVALRMFRASGVELLDHIVVYGDDFVSMRESDLLDEPEFAPLAAEFVVKRGRLDYRTAAKPDNH